MGFVNSAGHGFYSCRFSLICCLDLVCFVISIAYYNGCWVLCCLSAIGLCFVGSLTRCFRL